MLRGVISDSGSELRLQRELDRAELLLDLYARASELTDTALFEYVLDTVVALTGSVVGFFHLVQLDGQHVELDTWNAAALEGCTAPADLHCTIATAGNWVDCVRERHAVTYNDYANSPHRKGMPAGHVPLSRFMSVPVMDGDRVRFIFGVGNKPTDYDEHDLQHVQLVANELHKILHTRSAVVAMRASEEKFSRMFQGNPVSMAVLDLDTACYVEVNAAWQRQTGYSAAEVVGRDMWSLNLWEGFSPMNDLAALFNERGQIDRLGGSMRTKSGVMRSALITAHIVDIGGRDRVLTVLEDVTDRKRAESDLTRTVEQLGRLTNQAIVTISKLVEARDPYTAGHEARVADLAVAIAQEMSIEPERVAGLRVAGLLHDVGKTAVPSEILTRPGALSDVEWAMVRLHAAAGHEILSGIDFPWPVAAIVLQHHERLNGSGYPAGLTDGDIMLEARIIAVADVVEAMFAHRPYRPSRGIAAALDEIESGKGELYDADVVDACLALFREDRFIFADV